MDVDVIGRIRHTQLGYTKSLYAVYEAIINAIHAIEDRDTRNGKVVVRVKRSSQTDIEDEQNRQILGFDVEDNGIGFNDENFDSFNTSDSRHKEERGGQGVGRFLWLKVFDRARIESIYDSNGDLYKRSFSFQATPDGIHKHSITPVKGRKVGTVVHLREVQSRYENGIPARGTTIAMRIVEHCLKYFVLDRAPSMYLQDDDLDHRIDLHDIYDELVRESDETTFELNGKDFTIRHFLLNVRSGHNHKINYCADLRVVTDLDLKKRIPDLVKPLKTDENGEGLIYKSYVSGDYLNRYVNQERTGFYNAEDDDLFGGSLTSETIEDAAVEAAKDYLHPYLKPVKEEKRDRIRRFVSQEKPQFRHVLKHRSEEVDHIRPDISDDELDTTLYKIAQDIEVENREKGRELINGLEPENADEEEIRAKYEKFIDELNDITKSNLAKYITNRRMTLELLASRLAQRDSGKYALEDLIHRTIFPLQSTSDEVSYEEQNLWILDEKLAFHHYLASDKALTDMDVVESDSRKRPDLLVFDNPIAVIEDDQPSSGVAIFEFKRPMRDDYQDDKNPINQVLGYVRRIREGQVTDRSGRPIPVTDRTPFYCYIVADITSTLRTQADLADYYETPDGEGYFGYTRAYNAYVEIIGFDKLVRDAKRRNAILFDKLNLDY